MRRKCVKPAITVQLSKVVYKSMIFIWFETLNYKFRAADIDNERAVDLWGLAATLFQKKIYQQSLELYEVVVRMLPSSLEARGQQVSINSWESDTIPKKTLSR